MPASVAGARATTPQEDALASLQGMTLEQRVGQVFMVGTPATGLSSATASAITSRHVGGVILTGRSAGGVAATAGVTRAVQALSGPASTAGVGLLVSTDQEGGYVQVLSGPGFSSIPTGLSQGGLAPDVLRSDAAAWGRELRSAGVLMDLAPVLDTVPSPQAAPGNPPIGYYKREYGFNPAVVSREGGAFAAGLADAGVAATVKHFPGLGRVTGNTDTTAGVTDTVTVRGDAYFQPFADAVRAGAPALMMSTAYYSRIDPAHPAAFSPTVIGQVVRGDLGFQGVVISDDLAQAKQVAAWSPGDRALQFLSAGGDLVLTVDPATLPAMYDAVLARARTDAAFEARVDEAALRVLTLERAQGLVPVGGLGIIGQKYRLLGGWSSYLGRPTSPQYSVPGGVEQDYADGSVTWSPALGAQAVHGDIWRDWKALGGASGPLGLATSDEVATAGGRQTSFASGRSLWSPATGAHAVYGAILAQYDALGGSGSWLGLPLTDEADTPDHTGRYNAFQHGVVRWDKATGAVTVLDTRPVEAEAAAVDYLGTATGPAYPVPGGVEQDFAGGAITSAPGGATAAVHGDIWLHWRDTGGASGPLGLATADEHGTGDARGRASDFVLGHMYWTGTTGAHAVYGAIGAAYAQLGGPTGSLGYPLTDERDTADRSGRENVFEHGTITWRRADGAIIVTRS